MNKAINLDALKDVVKTDDEGIMTSFLRLSNPHLYEINNSGTTVDELKIFLELMDPLLEKLSFNQKNGYYLGCIANSGIREEFDVLRFSNNSILNIELKSQVPKGGDEAIISQLQRHNFYLSILNDNINAFTYVKSTSKLYKLDESDKLTIVSIKEFLSIIEEDFISSKDFSSLDLTDLIISPYTTPDKFRQNKYFLTDEQKQVKKQILNSTNNRIGLIGGPGTGKSLLLLDCADEFKKKNKKVLIVFGSQMNDWEVAKICNEIGHEIVPIRKMSSICLSDYDVVMFDEAQRLYEENYTVFKKFKDVKMIFSADQSQTLHPVEHEFNLEKKLIEASNTEVFKLKKKIRTDEALSSFIQKMMDLKYRGFKRINYDKIRIFYFSEVKTAKQFMKNMGEFQDYTIIEQTPYITKSNGITKMVNLIDESINTHSVVGREYDNVLVPLDSHYYYNEDGRLTYFQDEYYPYLELNMLFEALTRVKRNLAIVVINNPTLFFQLENIINWESNIDSKKNIK